MTSGRLDEFRTLLVGHLVDSADPEVSEALVHHPSGGWSLIASINLLDDRNFPYIVGYIVSDGTIYGCPVNEEELEIFVTKRLQ